MQNKLIWAYLIHLSAHMWDDEYSPNRGWYVPSWYTDKNNTDIEVWDTTVKYLAETGFNTLLIDVGDAVLYESHPEISAPDAWTKDFLKKKLDEIRALGITPIPKLNFSTGHNTWLKKYRRMISTPEYYTVCADLIKEVCELFGYPELFHLGFDEESPNFQYRQDMVIVRNQALWWHDLNFLAKECEKHGARPWIWSDYCWKHKELFLKNMSKSILQSNWYYGWFNDFSETSDAFVHIDTYRLLEEHGYDQVPTCSTWANNWNTKQTIAHGKKIIAPERLKGFMTAPWVFTYTDNKYALLSDAEKFYYGRKEFYPESF